MLVQDRTVALVRTGIMASGPTAKKTQAAQTVMGLQDPEPADRQDGKKSRDVPIRLRWTDVV